jgi:hypothetical protein
MDFGDNPYGKAEGQRSEIHEHPGHSLFPAERGLDEKSRYKHRDQQNWADKHEWQEIFIKEETTWCLKKQGIGICALSSMNTD